MTAPLPELVAVAWLKGVTALSNAVATVLPAPDATGVLSWVSTGFVTVTGTGGSPGLYMGWRESVLQLDVWAAPPVVASGRPPWNKAGKLWQSIYDATLDHANVPRLLTMPAATPPYSDARVKVAQLMGDPERRPSDVASYARYQCDMRFIWNAV